MAAVYYLWIAVAVVMSWTACRRGEAIWIEQIIVPPDFTGWVEIAQNDSSCPHAEVYGRMITLRADVRGRVCIAEELPETDWHKRDYRYASGELIPRDQVHNEDGTGATTYRGWIKRSASVCIGPRSKCEYRNEPLQLPPGPGWQVSDRERRVRIRFP